MYISPGFVIMEAYLLFSIQNAFNIILELHFRAQQSASEISGAYI